MLLYDTPNCKCWTDCIFCRFELDQLALSKREKNWHPLCFKKCHNHSQLDRIDVDAQHMRDADSKSLCIYHVLAKIVQRFVLLQEYRPGACI